MKLGKTTLHIIIAAALFTVLKLIIPTVNGLTPIGVNVIAAFAATVYLWLTEGVSWVSLVMVVLFGCTGVMPYSQIYASSFGSWITVMMLMVMVLNYALADLGITKRIVVWAITRKVMENRPWLFLTSYFFAIYVLCLVVDSVPASLIFLAMNIEMCEQFGCEKGDKLPKVLFLGALCSSLFAYTATPISHGIPVVFIGLMGNDFGIDITFGQWSSVGIPATMVLFVLMMIYFRVVLRPDVSPVNKYDFEAGRASLKPLTRAQTIGSLSYLAVIILWLGPELFSGILPGFATWLKAMGYSVPVAIAIGALLLIHDKGKPILDFPQAILNVSWGTIFLCALISLIGPAVTSENTGIIAFISTTLGPVFSVIGSSWVPIVLLASAMVVVMTNFMSCLVAAQIVYAIILPLIIAMPELGINGIGIAIMIGIISIIGIMTPPASGNSAIFISTDWYTPSDAIPYSIPIILISILVGTFVIYPMASMMLG